MVFMFFASRSCFKHFSLLQKKKCSLKSRKCLKQLREAKKHETIVEGQRLRNADIMESKCSRLRFFHVKTSKKSDADLYMHIYMYM